MSRKAAAEQLQALREAAEADLETFIKVVSPGRVLGGCHKELIQWWNRENRKDHQLVLYPRDHGKALSLTSTVLTPEGFKLVGLVEVGDTLVGFDGKPTKVTQLHPISEMDLYEVTTRDGRKVVCNGDHLWTVTCPSNTGSRLVTKPLKDILKNYKSPRFDKRQGKEFFEYRYFIPTVAPVQFDEKPLPIDPYTLGMWLGDGTSANGNITTADPEIFVYIPYEAKKLSSTYSYSLKGLYGDLKKEGLLNNKQIPEDYLYGSVAQREALLQGLMDSDGTCHKDGKWLYWSQSVKRMYLIDQVEALVRSLGGSCRRIDKTSPEGHKSVCLSIKLPKGVSPFKLSRKASLFKGSTSTKDAIVDIKPVGKGYARCISVSAKDGLFVTDDYVVTHNSAMVAYRVAWRLTKDPTLRFLYISATATLAQKQLGFIKQIFESEIHRRLWPEHINADEGKRSKWTQNEIELDHPKRKEEQIRDPSIFTAGLNTGITGLHFDIAVLDDIVVKENATTQEGRDKVAAQYSLLASIEGTGSEEWVVGTRYHPKDLYDTMLNMKEPVFDENGEIVGEEPIYEVLEKAVEDRGDGTGQFLWPRQQRKDGKWFGFDMKELARKRAKYQDKLQFRAQYYNDPSDPDSQPINPALFQYWDAKFLKETVHGWTYNGRRLNLTAAIDFAYSTRQRADFSALVVIGVDELNNIYVLEIDRFKAESLKGYFDHILRMSTKWGFKRLVAETTAAQQAIVKSLKTDYFAPHGLMIKVEEVKPTRHEGSKEERMEAILVPRYENSQVYHYRGGNTQVLEEELVMKYPAHDDVKDALANAIDFSVRPVKGMRRPDQDNVVFHPKFGGVIG